MFSQKLSAAQELKTGNQRKPQSYSNKCLWLSRLPGHNDAEKLFEKIDAYMHAGIITNIVWLSEKQGSFVVSFGHKWPPVSYNKKKAIGLSWWRRDVEFFPHYWPFGSGPTKTQRWAALIVSLPLVSSEEQFALLVICDAITHLQFSLTQLRKTLYSMKPPALHHDL